LKQDQSTRYEIAGTHFLFIDPDGSVPAETMPGVDYEAGVFALLNRILDKPRTFADIGAHYGFFTIYAKSRSPQSRMHAFEPSETHSKVLFHNLELNKIRGDVQVHKVALSEENANARFYDRTLQVLDENMVDSAIVSTSRLDDLNIYPDVVKIDVHGAEQLVLSGMTKTLANSVQHLFIELHAAHLLPATSSYGAIIDLIATSGLTLFELVDFRFSATPKLYLVDKAYRSRLTNYDNWSKQDRDTERMLYATRLP
jgi:FkbM family methyltransferase